MLTVQFSTQLTPNGEFSVPDHYLKSIPAGSQIQVILLVDSPASSAEPSLAQNGAPAMDDALPSLDEYVAYLRSRPLPETLIRPATESLHDYLVDSTETTELDFDEDAWNAQWDQIEAAMDAEALVDEHQRHHEIVQDLQQ